MTNEQKTAQTAPHQKQFIRVGLGNIDMMPVVVNGDIYTYPSRAFISKNQRCAFTSTENGKIVIQSEIEAPARAFNQDNTIRHQDFTFETTVTHDTHEKGRTFSVQTKHTNPTANPRGDFDFMEMVFDSPQHEKIYGLGLQMTETNFKGKKVDIITSEGGVGRGLEPLTTMMNDEKDHSGGTTTTSYAPAYTFSTSERRGFVFDHTEIGQVDFSNSDTSFNVMMWHTNEMNMNVVHGKTMKDVTTGITKHTGRMKALPEWTQKGAIVGLQGTEKEVREQYAALKKSKVPMVSVWM
jgi:alpha-glucosidase (family GH31 glycosyl hydrolase)